MKKTRMVLLHFACSGMMISWTLIEIINALGTRIYWHNTTTANTVTLPWLYLSIAVVAASIILNFFARYNKFIGIAILIINSVINIIIWHRFINYWTPEQAWNVYGTFYWENYMLLNARFFLAIFSAGLFQAIAIQEIRDHFITNPDQSIKYRRNLVFKALFTLALTGTAILTIYSQAVMFDPTIWNVSANLAMLINGAILIIMILNINTKRDVIHDTGTQDVKASIPLSEALQDTTKLKKARPNNIILGVARYFRQGGMHWESLSIGLSSGVLLMLAVFYIKPERIFHYFWPIFMFMMAGAGIAWVLRMLYIPREMISTACVGLTLAWIKFKHEFGQFTPTQSMYQTVFVAIPEWAIVGIALGLGLFSILEITCLYSRTIDNMYAGITLFLYFFFAIAGLYIGIDETPKILDTFIIVQSIIMCAALIQCVIIIIKKVKAKRTTKTKPQAPQ
ncbi:MAG: hypothetical protein ACTSXP_03325 [Promethearchaeota archaeon]